MRYDSLCVAMGIQGAISGNEFRARCPLHDDHNPSFSVNIETGLWMCHSRCGGGDFLQLVEKKLLCSYQEARDWVATNGRRTSVDQLSRQLAEELNQFKENIIVKIEEGWRSYYMAQTARMMPTWFLMRGFTWDTILRWGIRYDPIRDAIVLPVRWEGELLGIITRPLIGEPKYQNSEGLPKAKIFFGEITSNRKEIIICEGVLDALWLWQLGYNAVSVFGADISQEQVNILQEHRFGEVVLAMDNDTVGIKATREVALKLTKGGWLLPQIKFIQFPEGKKDPQDCSAEEFSFLFENRKDISIGLFS